MALRRKKGGVRKEPQFGLGASLAELRLGPRDRIPNSGSKAKKPATKRPVGDDDDDDPAPERKPRVSRSGSKRRSRRIKIGRLLYWGAVLGLWAVIAVVGVVVWAGAHLPPI